MVLNSLSDDMLQASIRCVATHGKFLELGKFDMHKNTKVGMNVFLRNVDFVGVGMDSFIGPNDPNCDKRYRELSKINSLLSDGINSGVVKPLPRAVFSSDQIEKACRYMFSGKHVGKILIKVQDETNTINPYEPVTVKAIPRTYFCHEKFYIIFGGLGGLGLEIANWMIDRGARRLVLISRSGVTTGYQEICLRRWSKEGAQILTPKLDLSNFEWADNFFRNILSTKTVGGIYNSCLVI